MYLGIYSQENNKTNKQKTKQNETKTGKKRKKGKCRAGLEPGTFAARCDFT